MMSTTFEVFEEAVRDAYPGISHIPLHAPVFNGNEKQYLTEAIDSTFVSSVGAFVDQLEKDFAAFTGAKYAVSTVNGTAALHAALVLCDVGPEDEVLTQPLSFVATCNAISYTGAKPVFIDVDKTTLGMSPEALACWLDANTEPAGNRVRNRKTGRVIRACVPMHTFGSIGLNTELAAICDQHNITLIEDAAESVGSYRNGIHAGRTSRIAPFSFNGNKIMTTGGGGMLITDDEELAARAKHLTTTGKKPHRWEYEHDMIAFNYRMPNLNAAVGCAQLEQLEDFLAAKRRLHQHYLSAFAQQGLELHTDADGYASNYWLNALILPSREARDDFLTRSNDAKIMTRPVWSLLSELPMFRDSQKTNLDNAAWLADRIVNIPSSVPSGI
jgi:aminotransferase in exopolysaccharide biosynthesis